MNTNAKETTTTSNSPTEPDNKPQIYVACRASAQRGVSYGCWIDCDRSIADIAAAILAMLASSAEPDAIEWEIQSAKGFAGIEINQYTSIEIVALHGVMLSEHGDTWIALVQWANEQMTLEQFESTFRGAWRSEAEFARHLFKDDHAIPDLLEPYVDWRKIQRDLLSDGFFSVWIRDTCFIFSDCSST